MNKLAILQERADKTSVCSDLDLPGNLND